MTSGYQPSPGPSWAILSEPSATQTPESSVAFTSPPPHNIAKQTGIPRSSPAKSSGKKRTTVADLMSASAPLLTVNRGQHSTPRGRLGGTAPKSQPLPRPRPKMVPRITRNATPGPSGSHSKASRVNTVSPLPATPPRDYPRKNLKRKFVPSESEPETSDWSPPPYPLPSPPKRQAIQPSPAHTTKPKSTGAGKRGPNTTPKGRKPAKQRKGVPKSPAKQIVEVIEISWTSEDDCDQRRLPSSQLRRNSTSGVPRSGPSADVEVIDLCSSDGGGNGTPPPASPRTTRSRYSHSPSTQKVPSPMTVSTPTPDLEIDLVPTRASTPEISIIQMIDSSPHPLTPQIRSAMDDEPPVPNSREPQAICHLASLVLDKPRSFGFSKDPSPAIFHSPIAGAGCLPEELYYPVDLDLPSPQTNLPPDLDIDEFLLSNDLGYPD